MEQEEKQLKEYYENASLGLKKMYIGRIGSLICTVFSLIPGFDRLTVLPLFVFILFELLGVYQTGKDIRKCKAAFFITLVGVLLFWFFDGISETNTEVGVVLSVADNILSIWTAYLICTSVADVMRQMGEEAVAKKGYLIWKIRLVCYCIIIVATVLTLIPGFQAAAVIVSSIITLLLSTIVNIVYVIFLHHSAKVLQA